MHWTDSDATRTAACFVTCCGLILSSIEWLTPPSKLKTIGVLSGVGNGSQLERAWRRWGLSSIISLRLGCATAYVLSAAISREIGIFALAAGLLCLPLRLRNPIGVFSGMNGAEHVMTSTLLALGPTFLLGSKFALEAALAFVAFRSLLEYLSAGATKLGDWKNWANGLNLRRVCSSSHYGHPRLAELINAHPALGGVLSMTVIGTELAVVLTPVLPPPGAELLLLAALSFHAATGIVMGLNTFPWAFLATYPAILHIRDYLLSSPITTP